MAAATHTLVRELTRFGLAGGLSNVVYVVLLILMRRWDWPWWLATGIAYAVSTYVSYVAQRRYTFQSDRPHGEAALRYIVLMGSCLALNSALMEIIMQRGRLHPVTAQALSFALVMSLSYWGQKRWIFAHPASKPAA